MTKENFTLYFSTFISGILITMFISALVTYLAISDIKFFLSIWPKNWFFAALVAFPTILFVKPVSKKITEKIVNIIFSNNI